MMISLTASAWETHWVGAEQLTLWATSADQLWAGTEAAHPKPTESLNSSANWALQKWNVSRPQAVRYVSFDEFWKQDGEEKTRKGADWAKSVLLFELKFQDEDLQHSESHYAVILNCCVGMLIKLIWCCSWLSFIMSDQHMPILFIMDSGRAAWFLFLFMLFDMQERVHGDSKENTWLIHACRCLCWESKCNLWNIPGTHPTACLIGLDFQNWGVLRYWQTLACGLWSCALETHPYTSSFFGTQPRMTHLRET